MREREYWRFCLEHVREYNHSYNYFAGMSDDAVARYQKDAVTGHRPTWKMGFNGGVDGVPPRDARPIRSRCCASSAARVRARAETPGAGSASGAQCRAQGVRHARPGDRRGRGRDQGALQGTGEAPPSRRQRRRPLHRGPPASRSSRRIIISSRRSSADPAVKRCTPTRRRSRSISWQAVTIAARRNRASARTGRVVIVSIRKQWCRT